MSIVKTVMLEADITVSSGMVMAADYKLSPFTLAYDGTITENVIDNDNIHSSRSSLTHSR